MDNWNKKETISTRETIIFFIIVFMILVFPSLYFNFRGIYVTIFNEIAIILTAPLIFMKIKRVSLREYITFEKMDKEVNLKLFFSWSTTLVFAGILSNIFLKFFPNSQNVLEALTNFFTSVSFPLQILLFCLMPAICEEFFFRGFIFKSLEQDIGYKKAIIFTGILFGVFHFYPLKILTTALLGILFSYAYYRTKNFFVPVSLHFINNFFSLFISKLFLEKGQNMIFLSSVSMLLLLFSIVGIFSIISLIKSET